MTDDTTSDGDDWEPTRLPWLGMTLDDARRQLSALHFAKETLSDGEQEVLAIAEELLRLLDQRWPGGVAR